MNKITNKLLAGAVIAVALTSCDERWEPPVAETGDLHLASMEAVVNEQPQPIMSNPGSRASRADIDVNPFLVTITSAADGSTKEYVFGEMDEIVTLPVGDYRADVESHKVAKAEWEHPYYLGGVDFKITKGNVTRVEPIVCKFASVGVSVSFDNALLPLLGDDVEVTVSANDEGSLTYTKDETRFGYFEALEGSMTMIATLTGTIDGHQVHMVSTFTDLAAGQRRLLVYKRVESPQPPVQTGTGDPNVGIDPSLYEVDIDGNVDTEEDGENPGNPWGNEDPEDPSQGGDDPNPPTPPTPGEDPVTFTSEHLDLTGMNNAGDYGEEALPAVVTITAEKKFAHLNVTIVSNDLTDEFLRGVGLAAQFDLCYPGEFAEGLDGLGLPCGDKVLGQTTTDFDITKFVPLLLMYPGEHSFKIEVEDAEGNRNTLVLKFKA